MANVTDAKLAGLGAVMELQQAMTEFQNEFFAPDAQRVQAVLYQQILDRWDANVPQINELARQNPEAIAQAEQTINAIRNIMAGKPVKGG